MRDFQIQKIVPIFRVNALVNAAYYNLPENYQFSGESHDFWELSYVDRGQVVIRHDDSSYLLKSGEMLFCKPDVFHSVRVWQGKPAAIVNIAFAVSAAFVFGDHMGFTAGFAPEMLPAMILGKLAGGVSAVAVALWLTRKEK